MNVAFDMGHLILTSLVGIVVFFLQRELARNDAVRVETLALIKNTNEKLDGHEARLNKHGTEAQLLAAEVNHLRVTVAKLEAAIEALKGKDVAA